MRLPRPAPDPVIVGLLVMLALTVALSISSYYSNRSQNRSVNQQSYDRCTDRQVNTTRLNDFAAHMATLEAGNGFVDQSLRDKRVAEYKALVLAAPKCGKP